MDDNWLKEAATRYHASNRETLEWMLSREPLQGAYIDTKVNAISGQDYDSGSGFRSPDFTYGWMQGRGLEALTTFARHYRKSDPVFATRLEDRARLLFEALSRLHRRDGHNYFLYDKDLMPIIETNAASKPQVPAGDIYTYSDAFAAKWLFAASVMFAPERTEYYVAYLNKVISAIEDGRFQMDESRHLSKAVIAAEPDDFGPRMIVLAVAGLLHRHGSAYPTEFADRFIDHIFERHFDGATGLLFNVPGHDARDVGHSIEFCGFAFEHLATRKDDPRVGHIISVLRRSLEIGLQGPGIALSLSAKTGKVLSPQYAWWPMPEAVRACALGIRLTKDQSLFDLWQRADQVFFENYWQKGKGYAFKTRTLRGPSDFVLGAPDLDPAYHTALSFLTATEAISNF